MITSTTFYVTGENVTAWNYRNEFQIELVSDKHAYLQRRDGAHSGQDADRRRRARHRRARQRAAFLRHPTQRQRAERRGAARGVDAPNVFVSVMLLRGANDSPRKFKEPDYRVGYCQLKVTRPESKLSVYVKPERKAYQPGDDVTRRAPRCATRRQAARRRRGHALRRG